MKLMGKTHLILLLIAIISNVYAFQNISIKEITNQIRVNRIYKI